MGFRILDKRLGRFNGGTFLRRFREFLRFLRGFRRFHELSGELYWVSKAFQSISDGFSGI